MLGKAHLTIGMAAAWTLAMPETVPAALPVIAGAAAGSLICDIDCDSPAERRDASKQRVLAAVITAAALITDKLTDAGMWRHIADLWCAGVAGLVITVAFANVAAHRGFSHSLIALLLETGFLYLIFPQCAKPFAIAFITHILLDMTNKKRVRLFYPAKKGVSLGLFYADRMANRVCEIAGAAWLILVIWASLH